MKKNLKIKKVVILLNVLFIWIISNWCWYLHNLTGSLPQGYDDKYKILSSDLSVFQQNSDLTRPMPSWIVREPLNGEKEKDFDKISSEYFSSNAFLEDLNRLDSWVSGLPNKKLSNHTNHINNLTAWVVNGKAFDAYLYKCVEVFPVNATEADKTEKMSQTVLNRAQTVRFIANVYRWCQALSTQYNTQYSFGGASVPFEVVAHSRLVLLEVLFAKMHSLINEKGFNISEDLSMKKEMERLISFIDFEFDKDDYAIEREQCLKAALDSVPLFDKKAFENENSAMKLLRIEIARLYPLWVERRIADYHKENFRIIDNYSKGIKDPVLSVESLEEPKEPNNDTHNNVLPKYEQNELIWLKYKKFVKIIFSVFWAPLYANAQAEYIAYTVYRPYGNRLRSLKFPEYFAKIREEFQKLIR